MSERALELANKFSAFNEDVIAFVESCSDEDWQKTTEAEGWTVAAVCRHIAGGHYAILDWAKMIVNGEALPVVTFDDIHDMNAEAAQAAAQSTKDGVLTLLRENGTAIAKFVSSLSDDEMDRSTHLALIDRDLTMEGFVNTFFIGSDGGHLTSVKATVGS